MRIDGADVLSAFEEWNTGVIEDHNLSSKEWAEAHGYHTDSVAMAANVLSEMAVLNGEALDQPVDIPSTLLMGIMIGVLIAERKLNDPDNFNALDPEALL